MMTDDEADRMMTDVVDAICEDNIDRAAEALEHMAQSYAKAFGRAGKAPFKNMKMHLINYTIDRLGKAASPMIHLKFQLAEQELMRKRRLNNQYHTSGANNGRIIIN